MSKLQPEKRKFASTQYVKGPFKRKITSLPGAPLGVRPARPRTYLDFAKQNEAAARAVRRCVIGILSVLRHTCHCGGVPAFRQSHFDTLTQRGEYQKRFWQSVSAQVVACLEVITQIRDCYKILKSHGKQIFFSHYWDLLVH